MTNDSLEFWKDYLIQTRSEIDVEKKEGTYLLHVKVLLIAGMLVLVKGVAGLFALVVLPFLMISLDLMYASRLDYIFHRWQFLETNTIPKLKTLLSDPRAVFFETEVAARHNGDDVPGGYYLSLEANVRTLVLVPSIAASAVAVALLLTHSLGSGNGLVYLVTILWLGLVTVLPLNLPKVYRTMYVLAGSIVTGAIIYLDRAAGSPILQAIIDSVTKA